MQVFRIWTGGGASFFSLARIDFLIYFFVARIDFLSFLVIADVLFFEFSFI